MNSVEFTRWMDYHKGAYPGLSAWLKANTDQIDHWERMLSRIELHQAKSATDSLVEGDEQPKGYGEHPRWIRRIAIAASGGNIESYEKRQDGPRVVDDQLVAECPLCMDYGIVSVLSPDCLKRLWNNDRRQHLSTCAIACHCHRGQKRRMAHWQDGHALFRIEDVIDQAAEEAGHYATCIDAEWAVAKRMLSEFDARRHTHPDFAAYGPQVERDF